MMILNDEEYHSTKERIEGFKKTLAYLNAPDNELKQKNPVRWQLNIDGLKTFIDDFTEQVVEYENLINRQPDELITFSINDLEEFPRVLIKARIAAKISQSSLAQRLGISLEQLYRAEDWEYQEATLTQLLEVSHALGIKVQAQTTLALTTATNVL